MLNIFFYLIFKQFFWFLLFFKYTVSRKFRIPLDSLRHLNVDNNPQFLHKISDHLELRMLMAAHGEPRNHEMSARI